jgi:ABC-type antimicrobial peptide transport system permease subunit
MLRTLGYKKRQLFDILNMQTLFFSLPATLLGILVMLLLLSGIKLFLYHILKFPVSPELDFQTFLIVSFFLLIETEK